MIKLITFLIFFFTISCNISKDTSLDIIADREKTEEIKILNKETNLQVLIQDPTWIKEFFAILKTAKKEPRKFIAKYKITFVNSDRNYILLINSNYINYEGKTYSCKYNIEDFVKKTN